MTCQYNPGNRLIVKQIEIKVIRLISHDNDIQIDGNKSMNKHLIDSL